MTVTRDELATILEELHDTLLGAVVQQARVPDRDRVVLALRQPGATSWLLLCAAPALGRLHLIDKAPPNPKESLAFQGLLRKEVRGTIRRVAQLAGERIMRLDIASEESRRSIVLELYGAGGNIVLLDGEDRVLGRAGSPRRPGSSAGRGERWEPPGERGEWTDIGSRAGLNGHDAVRQVYVARETQLHCGAARAEATRRLTRRRKELRRLTKRQRSDLQKIGSPAPLRRTAELLQGSFHLLRKGQRSVDVTDWAAPDQPTVTVPTDPALEPSQLVARAFSRARRAERAQTAGEERLRATLAALEEVEALAELMEEDEESAIEMVDELLPGAAAQSRGRREGPRLPYTAWRTPSGHEIRVGRGAADNDQLTQRHSRGNDVWLHVRGRPGAHVVVRDPGKSPAPTLLVLAAQLALAHSGLADGAREEVTWTRVKHVSKPKGSKPGSVVATQDKVLYVELDREALAALTRL